MCQQRIAQPPLSDGFPEIRELFAGCFNELASSRECLWVAHLDALGTCLKLSSFPGEACSVAFPIRSIIADAALHGSAGIVLAHNHPSGDPTPGQMDCLATRQLATAAQAIGCRILDHLVFADGHCVSFRTLGLL